MAMQSSLRPRQRPEDENAQISAAIASASSAYNNPVANERSGGSNSKGNPVDDIAMGFGMKDRDKSYYDRTANTIRRNQGEDAYNRYLQSYQYQNLVPRAGFTDTLLAGLGVPKMLGYKDEGDWYDGGGKYASGPRSSFGLIGGLLNALTGNSAKEKSYYDEVNQMIDSMQGSGAAAHLMANEPEVYNQMASNAIRALRSGKQITQPSNVSTTQPTPTGGLLNKGLTLDKSLIPLKRPTANVTTMPIPSEYSQDDQARSLPNPNLNNSTPFPSPQKSNKTTAGQDFMYQMAAEKIMGLYPTMPRLEQNALIEKEYQKIMQSMY